MAFIMKRGQDIKPQKKNNVVVNNNKKEIESKEIVMDYSKKIEAVEAIVNAAPAPVKKIKKDKGLIERTESSKIVLTEDNKQLLND